MKGFHSCCTLFIYKPQVAGYLHVVASRNSLLPATKDSPVTLLTSSVAVFAETIFVDISQEHPAIRVEQNKTLPAFRSKFSLTFVKYHDMLTSQQKRNKKLIFLVWCTYENGAETRFCVDFHKLNFQLQGIHISFTKVALWTKMFLYKECTVCLLPFFTNCLFFTGRELMGDSAD